MPIKFHGISKKDKISYSKIVGHTLAWLKIMNF